MQVRVCRDCVRACDFSRFVCGQHSVCAACRTDLPEIASIGIRGRFEAERRNQQSSISGTTLPNAAVFTVSPSASAPPTVTGQKSSVRGDRPGSRPIESLPRDAAYSPTTRFRPSARQYTVLSVAETSPAALAGIKPGDHVLTFNNEAEPRSGTSGWIAQFGAQQRRIVRLSSDPARWRRRHPHGVSGAGLLNPDSPDNRSCAERIYDRRQDRHSLQLLANCLAMPAYPGRGTRARPCHLGHLEAESQ